MLRRGGAVWESMTDGLFTKDLFRFLSDLRRHNDRTWFQEHRERYEDSVLEPALEFVRSFTPYLAKISPNFVADDRPSGGSVFRIYRDVRFSKDKSPYKTHLGIDFRHRNGKDVHTPSFYLHLQPGEVFAAAGVWHPDSATVRRIREFIVEEPERWKRATSGKAFRSRAKLSGDRLKRPPAGFDPASPAVDDLLWKDYVATVMLDEEAVTSPHFIPAFAETCRATAPLVRFLCEALDQPF
jgi:uncharacterized protein (TIGR02453 family)